MRKERCQYRDCGRPAGVYKMVAGVGGLDPEKVEIGGFCSAEHADLIPRPSDDAIARARAKLRARFGK
jgi:hypothetical protein